VEHLHTQPGNGPLYQQIKRLIVNRIVDGTWQPGSRLPSETRLGQEMGTSQGTVRKAVDDLVAENLLIRHQGRGTFVTTHTAQRELFHFFHLVNHHGIKQLPVYSQLIDCSRRRATREESDHLRIATSAFVISITRVRHLDDTPTIYESIALPGACFRGLDLDDDIPNELYGLYEKIYGITIYKATERLRAVAASKGEAKALGLAAGAPLLEINRIAETLDGTPVEWRISRCDSRNHSYLSENV